MATYLSFYGHTCQHFTGIFTSCREHADVHTIRGRELLLAVAQAAILWFDFAAHHILQLSFHRVVRHTTTRWLGFKLQILLIFFFCRRCSKNHEAASFINALCFKNRLLPATGPLLVYFSLFSACRFIKHRIHAASAAKAPT